MVAVVLLHVPVDKQRLNPGDRRRGWVGFLWAPAARTALLVCEVWCHTNATAEKLAGFCFAAGVFSFVTGCQPRKLQWFGSFSGPKIHFIVLLSVLRFLTVSGPDFLYPLWPPPEEQQAARSGHD